MLTEIQIALLRKIFYGNLESRKQTTVTAPGKDNEDNSDHKAGTTDHPFDQIRTQIRLFMTGYAELSFSQYQLCSHPYFEKWKKINAERKQRSQSAGSPISEKEDDNDDIFIPQRPSPPYVNIMVGDYIEHLKTNAEAGKTFFTNLTATCPHDEAASIFNQESFLDFVQTNLTDYTCLKAKVTKGHKRKIIYQFASDVVNYCEQYYKKLDEEGKLQDKMQYAKERRLAITSSSLYMLMVGLMDINKKILGLFNGVQQPRAGFNKDSPPGSAVSHQTSWLSSRSSVNLSIETTAQLVEKYNGTQASVNLTENRPAQPPVNPDGTPADAANFLHPFVPHLLHKNEFPYYKNQADLLINPELSRPTGKAVYPPAFWAGNEDIETMSQRVIVQLELFITDPRCTQKARENIRHLRDGLKQLIKFIHKSRPIFTIVYKEVHADRFWKEGDNEYEQINETLTLQQLLADEEQVFAFSPAGSGPSSVSASPVASASPLAAVSPRATPSPQASPSPITSAVLGTSISPFVPTPITFPDRRASDVQSGSKPPSDPGPSKRRSYNPISGKELSKTVARVSNGTADSKSVTHKPIQQLSPKPKTFKERILAMHKNPKDKCLFVGFICHFTKEVMENPTMLEETGHSFEKTEIENWLIDHDTDPITGIKLCSRKLTENKTLKFLTDQTISTMEEEDLAEKSQLDIHHNTESSSQRELPGPLLSPAARPAAISAGPATSSTSAEKTDTNNASSIARSNSSSGLAFLPGSNLIFGIFRGRSSSPSKGRESPSKTRQSPARSTPTAAASSDSSSSSTVAPRINMSRSEGSVGGTSTAISGAIATASPTPNLGKSAKK